VKLLSWNVNGFRASVRKGFYEFLENENPDILGIQEVKMHELPEFPTDFKYHVAWNPADKKGYSGTAVFSKEKPLSVKKGLGKKKFDSEGRVQTLEFDKFFFVNAYFPNSQRGLARLDFKMEFNKVFAKHVATLNKPVVICGDLNVAHEEIDIARPKANMKNAGFTPEERGWMTDFLSQGWSDSFREKHPKKTQYSWWTYRFDARKKDIGWRIDYFILPERVMANVEMANILGDVMGSDHAPVGIEVTL